MQVFPTKRLPPVVQSFIKSVMKPPAEVWLKTFIPAGPSFPSNTDYSQNITMVDLETGEALWSVQRSRLNAFTDSDTWRERVEAEGKERFPLESHHAIVSVMYGFSDGRTTYISVSTTSEAQVLYFDLGQLKVELTEPELFALAVLNVTSAYRNRYVRWLTARGVNAPAAFSALAARGLVRVAKNGAVTLLPEGRLRRDKDDVKEKYRQMDRES